MAEKATGIAPGFCQCGCGQQTTIAQQNSTKYGYIKGEPRRYLHGHNGRGTVVNSAAYARQHAPEHPRADASGRVWEHLLCAERALGKLLPPTAEVHHVNCKRKDNRNQNLVICENRAYHHLLHIRTRALQACGHAQWRRCLYCKQYDEPERMVRHLKKYGASPGYEHRDCANAYRRARLKTKKED